MTTNKPNVQRYDNMGCPEEICRVDTMHESDDGDYVLHEDYEALQAECEKLRKDAERYRWLRDGNIEENSEAVIIAANFYGEKWDEMIDAALAAYRKQEGELDNAAP